jgi:protocatechuate 3,4-dioxygenase beta subunit
LRVGGFDVTSVSEGAMAASGRRTRWRYGRVDLTRRRTLLGLSACATSALATTEAVAQAARCVLTADAGEGPFYFDPSLLRSDITDGMLGAPLEIAIQVTRAGDCATLAEARLDLWQADGLGLYSGYANQSGVGERTDSRVGRTYLRGTQFTDADGWVRFTTIYPSWYGGRTPHLHFKVLLGDDEVVASQIFFPDEVTADVFATWDPYRRYVDRRRVFNHNDPIAGGVICEVQDNGREGIRASAVVAVTGTA